MSFTERLTKAVRDAGPAVVRVRSGRGRRGRLASGIAWTADRVLTAAHAVPAEGSVRLRLEDGNEQEAEVIGRDGGVGVALLRAEGAGLAPPTFRDPSTLAVGEPVLALGRPGRSVRASLRIVGALGDEVRTPGGGHVDRWIESDRGFPRGFEGGPLVDLDGTVVGLNTAALLRGADLAIPEVTLRATAEALERDGGVRRGYLGVAVQSVRLPASASADAGLIVVDVADDGPAAGAGVLLGDVILEVDGAAVRSPRALHSLLRHRADAEVRLSVLRAGKPTDVTLTAGARLG